MSGVYIPGMKMPNRGHTVTLTITGGGEAVVQYYDCKPQLTVPIVYKAVLIPDHGRLVDADALEKLSLPRTEMIDGEIVQNRYVSLETIRQMPTVIPADKEAEA